MAIQKMKLIHIMGPVDLFDDIMERYVMDRDVQIEDAMKVTHNIKGLEHFTQANPFSNLFKECKDICQFLEIQPDYQPGAAKPEEAVPELLEQLRQEITKKREQIKEWTKRIGENNILCTHLEHMSEIDVPLEEMFSFEFMRFRFGRMTRESYMKLVTYLRKMPTVFLKGAEEDGYVYGMYLTPHNCRKHVDDVFASLNFERIRISEKAVGKPRDALLTLRQENESLQKMIEQNYAAIKHRTEQLRPKLMAWYSYYKRKYYVYEIREKSAHTEDSFYMVCWAVREEAKQLEKALDKERDVMVMSQDPVELDKELVPPTKMKNRKWAQPFEMFVEMYGLPNYREMDATPLLAITYILMFGMMFGDVGQGAVLAIAGFILYQWKKIRLAGIVSMVGVSGTVFGFVYGSVFGNEELIPGLIHPMESTNTLLILAVAFGVIMLIIAMIANMINAVKMGNRGRLLFGQNGFAGLVFYVAVIAVVVGSITKGASVPVVVGIFLFGIPLLLIFLQQPLGALLNKKKQWLPERKGEFITENLFELFEILLSYITNTISFIRIGAFALVHAGMMMVVYSFVEMAGSGGPVVLVFGNAFVMCMEAFIVCIQTLRLEFYEMFGRFFDGDGRPFEPYKSILNK